MVEEVEEDEYDLFACSSLVSSLEELAAVVNCSSDHNVAQIAGNNDRSDKIPTYIYIYIYNWTKFLKSHFRPIPGIKKYLISSNTPGEATLKRSDDGPEVNFKMRKHNWIPTPDELPPVISPTGLSVERQCFENIRRFCSPETRDKVLFLFVTSAKHM